jgi:uncharacterized membrane protein SirB2
MGTEPAAGPDSMNWYTTAKTIHVACVGLSIAGFAARYALLRRGSTLVGQRFVRVAPHVNDTLLLGAAIVMLWAGGLNPFAVPWLSAKIAGLIVYIALGMIALRHGRSAGIRGGAFLAALASFGYVVTVAFSKNPLGPLAWLVN